MSHEQPSWINRPNHVWMVDYLLNQKHNTWHRIITAPITHRAGSVAALGLGLFLDCCAQAQRAPASTFIRAPIALAHSCRSLLNQLNRISVDVDDDDDDNDDVDVGSTCA